MEDTKKTVIKVYFMKPKASWWELTKEQKQELHGKVREADQALFKKYNVKSLFVCDSFWSTEDWLAFGAEEYPSIEAAQECTLALGKLEFFRYIESRVVFGTPGKPVELQF